MNGVFNKAILQGISLLMELPRKRQSVSDARIRFEHFKSSYPKVGAELVTHVMPASDDADYDLLLSQPDVGTLAISWHPERGISWTSQYSDHWAANFVLSVDGTNTTIQSALIYLNSVLKGRENLMEDLINRSLISAAIAESPPEISEADIDKAVDAFRIGQGLYSAAATQKWLDETHLTMDALRDLVTVNAQVTIFKQELTASLVRPYFDSHRQDFERITVMHIHGLSQPTARKFAETWKCTKVCPVFDPKWSGTGEINGKLETFYASELPADCADAAPQTIVGPLQRGAVFQVAQIVNRKPARLDQATRMKITDRLFEQWLVERRKSAKVQWHWV